MVQICTYHGIKHGEDLARLSFGGDMTISNGRHDRDCEKEHLSGLELCCIIGNIKLPLKRSKRLASEWKCKSWSNIGKCPLEVPALHLPIVVVLLHSFHHLPHGSSRYEHVKNDTYMIMHHASYMISIIHHLVHKYSHICLCLKKMVSNCCGN